MKKINILLVTLALLPGLIGDLESTIVGNIFTQSAPAIDIMFLAAWSVDSVLVILLDKAL